MSKGHRFARRNPVTRSQDPVNLNGTAVGAKSLFARGGKASDLNQRIAVSQIARMRASAARSDAGSGGTSAVSSSLSSTLSQKFG